MRSVNPESVPAESVQAESVLADSSPSTGAAQRREVSIPLIVITLVFFVLGLGLGVLELTRGSREQAPHNPADNMIVPHFVIGAAVLVAAVALTVITRSLRWVGTLFSARTGARIRATFRDARHLTGVLRCVLFVVLAVFVLYVVLRMGLQATAGLNPNFTVNAWGGPTAVGAFAAHGVDALVSIGLACLLGHFVLRRADRT